LVLVALELGGELSGAMLLHDNFVDNNVDNVVIVDIVDSNRLLMSLDCLSYGSDSNPSRLFSSSTISFGKD
jgi:hypothetical protein